MSVAGERRVFKALVAAEREVAAAVEDALTSAEFSGASQQVRSLAAEVQHLRACIERCKSVQTECSDAAVRLQKSAEYTGDCCDGAMADACRGIGDELAKVLDGF